MRGMLGRRCYRFFIVKDHDHGQEYKQCVLFWLMSSQETTTAQRLPRLTVWSAPELPAACTTTYIHCTEQVHQAETAV